MDWESEAAAARNPQPTARMKLACALDTQLSGLDEGTCFVQLPALLSQTQWLPRKVQSERERKQTKFDRRRRKPSCCCCCCCRLIEASLFSGQLIDGGHNLSEATRLSLVGSDFMMIPLNWPLINVVAAAAVAAHAAPATYGQLRSQVSYPRHSLRATFLPWLVTFQFRNLNE